MYNLHRDRTKLPKRKSLLFKKMGLSGSFDHG
jgi:hypothetical protein